MARIKHNRMQFMSHHSRILIADDDPSIVRLLRHYLEPLDAEILEATDGHQALAMARANLPEVILLDVMMPGRSGWDVCQALKGVRRTRDIMIVLITAKGDVKDRLTGLQAGADDYLVKPFQKNDVTWRISRLLEIAEKRRKEEYAGNGEDSLQDLLEDPATGLPTVPLAMSKAREALIEREKLGIIHIDVEQFEAIEEEYGWAFFDEFLRCAADAILEEARSIEGVAAINRVGSSGFFLFVVPEERGSLLELMERELERLQKKLADAMRLRFPTLTSGEVAFFVGYSIISYSPQIRLERQIYRGMQMAADAVRQEEKKRKQQLVDEMREIIDGKALSIVFQPIVRASDCSIYGYELLTRGPAKSSFTNSDMLFSFARENEMAWDLEKVAITAMIERLRGVDLHGKKCLVNLEAETVQAFAENLEPILEQFSSHPGQFVFELTERAAIEDYVIFRGFLEKLRERGFGVAIDDAGSGYASLEAIASLAPDYLKITKGLISTIAEEPIKQDLMKLLVELAHKINARTIAEGIETLEEYEWCRKLGIDLLQGYFLARPEERFVDWIEIPEGCEPLQAGGRV
jgi:EAL domain-containing protein (putative c-di-GMP-specific phosphodiesterase class I)/DNA-binding response OmpR family regulator